MFNRAELFNLGSIQTIQFKSYLLSVGIANPVTRWVFVGLFLIRMFQIFRETHGSGSNYHKELSKQLATFLEVPLKVFMLFD